MCMLDIYTILFPKLGIAVRHKYFSNGMEDIWGSRHFVRLLRCRCCGGSAGEMVWLGAWTCEGPLYLAPGPRMVLSSPTQCTGLTFKVIKDISFCLCRWMDRVHRAPLILVF